MPSRVASEPAPRHRARSPRWYAAPAAAPSTAAPPSGESSIDPRCSTLGPRAHTERAVECCLRCQRRNDPQSELARPRRSSQSMHHVTAARRLSRSSARRARQASSSGPRSAGAGLLGERRVVLGVAATPGVRRRRARRAALRRTDATSRGAGTASSRSRGRPSTIDLATRSASASTTSQSSMPSPLRRPLRRRRCRSCRRTRRGGRTRSAPVPSSSEYDQSTVARSVWWRSTAVRRPPVSRRNRSSRRSAISRGVHRDDPRRGELDGQRDPVEAPADLGDRVGGRRRRARSRPAPRARARRSRRDRVGAPRPHRARHPRRGRRATGAPRPARPRRRDPRGSSRGSRTLAALPEHAFAELAGRVEEVLAVVEHQQQLAGRGGTRGCWPSRSRPGRGLTPERGGDDLHERVRVGRRPRARRATRRRGSGGAPRPRPGWRGGSSRRRRRR